MDNGHDNDDDGDDNLSCSCISCVSCPSGRQADNAVLFMIRVHGS